MRSRRIDGGRSYGIVVLTRSMKGRRVVDARAGSRVVGSMTQQVVNSFVFSALGRKRGDGKVVRVRRTCGVVGRDGGLRRAD
jgi:hypothetical protein